MKKIVFTCLAILISLGFVSANPGVNVTINPGNRDVSPGGTALYTVSVSSISDVNESIELYIENPQIGWTYEITPQTFNISPDEMVDSDLLVSVPDGTVPGLYDHTLNVPVYLPGFVWLFPMEASLYYFYVTVKGPVSASEFPFSAASLLIVAVAPAFVFLFVRGRA